MCSKKNKRKEKKVTKERCNHCQRPPTHDLRHTPITRAPECACGMPSSPASIILYYIPILRNKFLDNYIDI